MKIQKPFCERYTPNWSGKIYVIKEIKNIVPWTSVISDLNQAWKN